MKIRHKTFSILLVALMLTTARPELAYCDMLFVSGEPTPRFGRKLEGSDESTILFEAIQDDKTEKLRIAREKVELLVITVDERRLEKLNPDDLQDYRDYAEELSAQQQDPLARNLAIRLYLIAAANGLQNDNDPSVALSALAGLAALGRTPNERKNFEVLRLVWDRRDHLVPLTPSATADQVLHSPNTTVAELLAAVRLLRKGEFTSANDLFRQEAIQEALSEWSNICAPREISDMLSSKQISLPQLNKLLNLELALQKGELPIPDRQSTDWAEQAAQTGTGWTHIPDFETVTEFDPRETIYRNGEWVSPR